MSDKKQTTEISINDNESYTLNFISPHQISMIDEAMGTLGDYGEVRLVVEKGRLRFVVTQKSVDALNWRPTSITG